MFTDGLESRRFIERFKRKFLYTGIKTKCELRAKLYFGNQLAVNDETNVKLTDTDDTIIH